MAEILYIPETLRSKLGEDGAKDLAALLNQAFDQSVKRLRENVSETAAERIERRIAETKTDVVKEITAVESRLVWKMLAFMAGQTGVLYLLINAAR
ncbi:MAG: hypothetical protein AB1327_11450 [Bacillota bacterium]